MTTLPGKFALVKIISVPTSCVHQEVLVILQSLPVDDNLSCRPKDATLLSLLLELFAVLERRFNVWDRDEAGMLLFTAVEANLALSGFINRKALENIWRQVDMDQNGTLDFGEFLSLMFLWTAVGNYETIFTIGDNARVVSDAFADIQDLFKSYDRNNRLVLHLDELEDMVSDHLAPLAPLSFPAEMSASKGVTCPQLLHLLYTACAQHPGNNIPGKYQNLGAMALAQCQPTSKRHGPRSSFWIQLREAFLVLERDFLQLDCDENGKLMQTPACH